jgi:hypothetical protein
MRKNLILSLFCVSGRRPLGVVRRQTILFRRMRLKVRHGDR